MSIPDRSGPPARPERARIDPAPPTGGIASAWVGLATVAVLFPTLARTPQSGDGAEIVTVALRGGVLHPTGFPLQAWIDRALVAIPGIPPALAIAAFGLMAHAAAAALIADALRRLGVASAPRVLAAAAFVLFPSLWTLAVEPEVFALAHLCLAVALWATVPFRGGDARARRRARRARRRGLRPAPGGARGDSGARARGVARSGASRRPLRVVRGDAGAGHGGRLRQPSAAPHELALA